MNRRDIIIAAVLLNTAIIAVLLIMAVNTDEEVLYDRPTPALEVPAEVSIAVSPPPMLLEPETVGFEEMLGDYPSTPDDFFVVDDDLGLAAEEKPSTNASNPQKIENSEVEDLKVADIIVKKGDSLDKIARANGTTIEAIKQLNHLKTERLSIGQQLKVPVGLKKSAPSDKKPEAQTDKKPEEQASANAVYYTLKSGDTPWKIAKQQHISMEDILRLNNLNEEKARNLKIGDKIRIH